jgi:hypothetical protein
LIYYPASTIEAANRFQIDIIKIWAGEWVITLVGFLVGLTGLEPVTNPL